MLLGVRARRADGDLAIFLSPRQLQPAPLQKMDFTVRPPTPHTPPLEMNRIHLACPFFLSLNHTRDFSLGLYFRTGGRRDFLMSLTCGPLASLCYISSLVAGGHVHSSSVKCKPLRKSLVMCLFQVKLNSIALTHKRVSKTGPGLVSWCKILLNNGDNLTSLVTT